MEKEPEATEMICRTKPTLSTTIIYSDGKSKQFDGEEATIQAVKIFRKECKSKDMPK